MNDVLVSIITVCYNSEKTIGQAIESVLNQTYEKIEYIIIDGVSTDNTVKIAEGYSQSFLERGFSYKIISEPDNGIYEAMNKGITMSSGEIVGMINSDDWYEAYTVEKVVMEYQKTNFDLLFGDLRVHFEGKISIKHSSLSGIVTSRTWNHPTSFVAKRVYDEKLYKLESIYDDFDMYIRLRKEKRNIVVLNEVLANFRFGGTSNKKTLRDAWSRMKIRYRIYRSNGYSRFYLFECLFIEAAKYTLS